MSDQRIVVWLIASFGFVSNCCLLPKVFHGPQGAGIDVARSYIALALGRLLILNCLWVGIGGGMVPYNVYWNIGPSRPFASIAIGMRSLLLAWYRWIGSCVVASVEVISLEVLKKDICIGS